MSRARLLCADPSQGMENATFWTQQCYTAVRCLLHAAALDHRGPVEPYRWSLSPVSAQDAVDILTTDPAAATAWDSAREAILAADPRQRDSTWSMVANVFAPLADPQVLDAVSPEPGEEFDPQTFPAHQRHRTVAFRKGSLLYRPPVPAAEGATVIVCEGPLDVLAIAAAASERGAQCEVAPVAPSGTALSCEQANQIASLSTGELVICADADQAGHAGHNPRNCPPDTTPPPGYKNAGHPAWTLLLGPDAQQPARGPRAASSPDRATATPARDFRMPL